MIYAYDQAIQMPVKDLYDTQIMAMAINAAKDMYEKGQKQLDDFHKLYGDFFSPIGKDMESYNNLVLNPVRDAVNEIYAIGGDPIRSPEGRAALARIIRNVPTGEVNKLRQSAETAKTYQKALAEAIAKGEYDPEVDKFFNPVGLDEWDTLNMGTWSRPAPTTIKTIKEATNDWFDKRTAHDLTPEQMKAEGYAYNPAYDYTGWLYGDLLETAGKMTPGWQSSLEARYYRAQAKKQLEAAGVKDITPEMIEAQLQRNVAEVNREYIIKPNKKANDFALDNYRTANDIKAHAANAAIDDRYKALQFQREHPELDPNNPASQQNLQFSQRVQSRIMSDYDSAVRQMAYDYAVANRDARLKYETTDPDKKRSKYDSKFWGNLVSRLENGDETLDLKKYGLVDKNGRPTQKLETFALRRMHNLNQNEKYWDLRSYTPASENERKITRTLFAGSDRTAKIGGANMNLISLGDSGVTYAPYRKAGILDNVSRLPEIQKEFAAVLKNGNLQGYVDNSPVKIANIPGYGNNNQTDTQGNVLVSAADIEKFFERLRSDKKTASKYKNKTNEKLAKELGIKLRTYTTKRYYASAGEEKESSDNYYIVPIIRTSNITPDDINQQYNKLVYGTTSASGERFDAAEAGLQWLKND